MNKKVLLVIPSLGSGGAERQLVNLSILLKGKGFDVEFVVYHDSVFFKHILDDHAIVVNKISSINLFDRMFKVRKFIRSSGCQVVISFLETANFLCCYSAIGKRQWRLITTERSSKLSTFNSIRGKVFCWFRRYSDVIVCNSYNAKQLWERFCPEYSQKLSVIYNAVVLPDIDNEYKVRKNGKLNVVVAASYHHQKNPLGLVKAVAAMDSDQRAKLVINWYGRTEITKGNRRAYDESMSLIKKEGLQDVIFLNEATSDIANKMKEADVVGLFSRLEGLPNAICEAMMIGKPIIMTNVSDFQILVDESNGIVCDTNNDGSIKDALVKMLCLSDLELISLGKASKDKACQLFCNERILDKWVSCIG